MAPPQVLDWSKLTEDTIVFESSKQNKHNGISVPVKYKDENGRLHPIVIQTPVMSLPFGISDKELEKYGRKIEASLSFPNYAPSIDSDGEVHANWEDEGMSAFFKWFAMWDELNPRIVAERSDSFFKKKISQVVIEELYKPNIKPSSKPDKYSPTVRCKIPVASDQPTADFFALEPSGTVPIDMNRVKNGARVLCLLKTSGLWFAGKSFGMNFHVVQMVQLQSDKFEGCAVKVPPSLYPAPYADGFDPGTPPNAAEDAPPAKKLKSDMSI